MSKKWYHSKTLRIIAVQTIAGVAGYLFEMYDVKILIAVILLGIVQTHNRIYGTSIKVENPFRKS